MNSFQKIILALFCFVCQCALAQVRLELKSFSTDDGLSINTVNAVQFDKNGFLWIATADGLQRFNGYSFNTFKHSEADSNSLYNNSVYALYQDSNENLWITQDKAICVKRKDRFDFIRISKQLFSTTEHHISLVSEDETSIGLMQPGFGLIYINKKTLAVEKIQQRKFPTLVDDQALNDGMFSLGLRNGAKDLWVKTADTIFHFYKQQVDAIAIPASRRQQLANVLNLGNDSLLVISSPSVFISHSSRPFVPIKEVQTKEMNIPLNTSLILTRLDNHQFLLSGSKILAIYNDEKGTIEKYAHAETVFKTMGSNGAFAAAKDEWGNLWLGFNGGGMAMIKNNGYRFTNIYTKKEFLPYTLYQHTDGKIYCAMFRHDVLAFDTIGNTTDLISLPPGNRSVRGIAKLDSNILLLKYCEPELAVYDIAKRKLTNLSHLLPYEAGRSRGAGYNFNIRTQEISKGEVWFNYGTTICSVKKGKSDYVIKKLHQLPEAIFWFTVTSNHLWVATKNTIYDYKHHNEKIIELPGHITIKCMAEIDNNLWVATTEGVYIVHDKKIVRQINETNGLKNNFVYSIMADKHSNAWLSTNRGLAVVFPNYTVRSFTREQGIQGDEFNTGCFYQSPSDIFYYAGINGITFFNPEKVLAPTKPVTVFLHSIQVNNKVWQPTISTEKITDINLKYNENVINLSFGTNDFASSPNSIFKIQFTNADDEKTDIIRNTNNNAQFILAPGSYLLHVWEINENSNTNPLLLHINVRPAWYQTLVFKSLIFVILCCAVFGLLYSFLKRQQRKQVQRLLLQQQVQEEKERLSRDLHDNLGSQLTLLINNINLIEADTLTKEKSSVKTVKQNAVSMLQVLRQTIWIMSNEKISTDELADKMIEHAVKYTKGFSSLNLNVKREARSTSTVVLTSDIVLQLFRILQEAVTNACKHSRASLLTVGFSDDENGFSFFVEDNGKGFSDVDSKHESYGLKNMKKRCDEIRSELHIHSSPENGTKITVHVHYSLLK